MAYISGVSLDMHALELFGLVAGTLKHQFSAGEWGSEGFRSSKVAVSLLEP